MKTRITELFGIKHPILQSPMAFVAHAPLVIATCNAGGLGLFGPPGLTLDEMRRQIREIKAAVGGKPFGVNILPIMPYPLYPVFWQTGSIFDVLRTDILSPAPISSPKISLIGANYPFIG